MLSVKTLWKIKQLYNHSDIQSKFIFAHLKHIKEYKIVNNNYNEPIIQPEEGFVSNLKYIKCVDETKVPERTRVVEYCSLFKSDIVKFHELDNNDPFITLNIKAEENNSIISVNTGLCFNVPKKMVLLIYQEKNNANVFVKPVTIDSKNNGLLYLVYQCNANTDTFIKLSMKLYFTQPKIEGWFKNNDHNIDKQFIPKKCELSYIFNFPKNYEDYFTDFNKSPYLNAENSIWISKPTNIICSGRKRFNDQIIDLSGIICDNDNKICYNIPNQPMKYLCIFFPSRSVKILPKNVKSFSTKSPLSGCNGYFSSDNSEYYKKMIELNKKLYKLSNKKDIINKYVSNSCKHRSIDDIEKIRNLLQCTDFKNIQNDLKRFNNVDSNNLQKIAITPTENSIYNKYQKINECYEIEAKEIIDTSLKNSDYIYKEIMLQKLTNPVKNESFSDDDEISLQTNYNDSATSNTINTQKEKITYKRKLEENDTNITNKKSRINE
uniref:Uncharacterized protein n=1 Tax=Faxonius propinquus nudivirus TaxID=3139431 RepID=A0AAU8GD26_9VIRU